MAQEVFDLAILDLRHPVESSLIVLHEIRESSCDSEILILSTAEQVKDRVTVLIQGADDFMVKPFTADELQARILALARRRSHLDSVAANDDHGGGKRFNEMIETLRQICRSDNPAIELMISETNLTNLVGAAIGELRGSAARRNIRIRRPQAGFPGILVDARWMEHLLINLLDHAITQSPDDAEIVIHLTGGTGSDVEFGEILVNSELAQSAHNPEPVTSVDPRLNEPFSLAQFCAKSLQLRLLRQQYAYAQQQILISNIRVI